MTQYYFLATALPPLHFGVQPEITFQDFATLLHENLTPADEEQALKLRRYYDILNIRSFWKGYPLEPYGTWNQNELEESILDRENIPEYLNAFLDQYKDTKERLAHFGQVIAAYFNDEQNNAVGFVKEYLTFEKELRLVLVALRAKQMKRDLLREIQFEDPSDEFIAQILAQKDAPEYDPPERYQAVKQIFLDYIDQPLELHQALNRFRFEAIEEMVGVSVFSLDYILGYMMRLIMILNGLELNARKGIEMVDKMIEERA